MRVLVCGGRDFSDRDLLHTELDRLRRERGIDVLIEGDARGADRLAGYWARKNRIDNIKFPARWEEHGRKAGPIRNEQMLRDGRPDLIVAFPGGRGTADMVSRGERAGIEILMIS